MKKIKQDDAEKDMETPAQGPAAEEAREITELPSEEISRLRFELEAKAKEAAANYERFLRACADVENYKKRAEREKVECVNFANETLISEVLPVIDNLCRALEHANDKEAASGDSLREGVSLTIGQLYGVLKKFGLEEIKAIGERFDPVMHHAISHEETEEVDEGMVVKEFQKGYLLKGRLLRASMVAVAKKPAKAGAN